MKARVLLFAAMLGFLAACSKPSPQQSPSAFNEVRVARKDGSREPIYMNHQEAKTYCEAHGQRLPTTREFAMHAKGQGAAGLVEKSDRSSSEFASEPEGTYKPMRAIGLDDEETRRMKQQGFSYVLAANDRDRLHIDFYYKSAGYVFPGGLFRVSNYVVWTSADAMPESGSSSRELCYGFFMKAGYFFKTACQAKAMVLCRDK